MGIKLNATLRLDVCCPIAIWPMKSFTLFTANKFSSIVIGLPKLAPEPFDFGFEFSPCFLHIHREMFYSQPLYKSNKE